MKRVDHLNDTRFAHHLRLSSDPLTYFLRPLVYILMAVLGVIISIFTNASGVKYDGESGVVYRQAYRVQVGETLVEEVDKYDQAEVLEFTAAIPSDAVFSDGYAFDSLEILNDRHQRQTDDKREGLVLGLPVGTDTYLADVALYVPGHGTNNYPILASLTAESIRVPTIFLPPALYEIYNRAFEAVFRTTIQSPTLNQNSLSLRSLPAKHFGVFDDVDLQLSIDDCSLDAYLTSPRTIGKIDEVSVKIGSKDATLKIMTVEGETRFSYDRFYRYGQDLPLGKTLVFKKTENAYKARNILAQYEDHNATFNNSSPYETSFEAVYSILGNVMMICYIPLIVVVFNTAIKSRELMLTLAKAGFKHHISCREYTLSTFVVSILAIVIGSAVLGSLSTLLPNLGNMVWFNAFDYILIAVISLVIGGLDSFVATRRISL